MMTNDDDDDDDDDDNEIDCGVNRNNEMLETNNK